MGPAVLLIAARLFFASPLFAQAPAPEAEALRIARAMTGHELAAQVLLTGIDGKGTLSADMAALLGAVPAGGIMLFRYNLSVKKEEIAPFLAQIRAAAALSGAADEARSGARIAPFIAVDHEGGLVHRFGEGVGRLPPPLSYWEQVQNGQDRDRAVQGIEEAAYRSGAELYGLGITVNLAPIGETLSPGNRAFLGSRSYGPDPAFVEAAAAAFIRGMGRAGIVCVIKHFPGNSGEDPHRRGVSLAGDRAVLDTLVAPMAALLRPGRAVPPPLVMVSHARVPAWDAERSASLSPAVISRWLRGELGFNGVVLADDFSMAGSTERDSGEAVVAALNAGVDMVMCWPSTVRGTHQAILAALAGGRIARERLVEAAARIITVKMRAGLVGGAP
jgi:beta-N-acetylhexosaminidase